MYSRFHFVVAPLVIRLCVRVCGCVRSFVRSFVCLCLFVFHYFIDISLVLVSAVMPLLAQDPPRKEAIGWIQGNNNNNNIVH